MSLSAVRNFGSGQVHRWMGPLGSQRALGEFRREPGNYWLREPHLHLAPGKSSILIVPQWKHGHYLDTYSRATINLSDAATITIEASDHLDTILAEVARDSYGAWVIRDPKDTDRLTLLQRGEPVYLGITRDSGISSIMAVTLGRDDNKLRIELLAKEARANVSAYGAPTKVQNATAIVQQNISTLSQLWKSHQMNDVLLPQATQIVPGPKGMPKIAGFEAGDKPVIYFTVSSIGKITGLYEPGFNFGTGPEHSNDFVVRVPMDQYWPPRVDQITFDQNPSAFPWGNVAQEVREVVQNSLREFARSRP